jgi:hypothetical protein
MPGHSAASPTRNPLNPAAAALDPRLAPAHGGLPTPKRSWKPSSVPPPPCAAADAGVALGVTAEWAAVALAALASAPVSAGVPAPLGAPDAENPAAPQDIVAKFKAGVVASDAPQAALADAPMSTAPVAADMAGPPGAPALTQACAQQLVPDAAPVRLVHRGTQTVCSWLTSTPVATPAGAEGTVVQGNALLPGAAPVVPFAPLPARDAANWPQIGFDAVQLPAPSASQAGTSVSLSGAAATFLAENHGPDAMVQLQQSLGSSGARSRDCVAETPAATDPAAGHADVPPRAPSSAPAYTWQPAPATVAPQSLHTPAQRASRALHSPPPPAAVAWGGESAGGMRAVSPRGRKRSAPDTCEVVELDNAGALSAPTLMRARLIGRVEDWDWPSSTDDETTTLPVA